MKARLSLTNRANACTGNNTEQGYHHGRNHPHSHPRHLPRSPSVLCLHDGGEGTRHGFKELKREIEVGAIVTVSTFGERVPSEEMMAAAMRMWEQAVIEEALGDEAATVLPEAIRLAELRARVPRYQREMLVFLARRNATTVDEVLTRELEDVACEHAAEVAAAVPGFSEAMMWPVVREG